MKPTEDIIPIAFMGGSGGNFLCHFIISAKRKDKTLPILSEHGNVHNDYNYKDLDGPALGPKDPDSEKLKFLLSQEISDNVKLTPPPYYTVVHFTETKLLATNFKKAIKIIFDKDDVNDIATSFVAKYQIDTLGESNDPKQLNIMNVASQLSIFKWHKYFLKEDYSNILFISWKELFLGDIDQLINKISEYTGIESDYFLKDSLIMWRIKTQQGLDNFRTKINNFRTPNNNFRTPN
jgi:hypothetical protein